MLTFTKKQFSIVEELFLKWSNFEKLTPSGSLTMSIWSHKNAAPLSFGNGTFNLINLVYWFCRYTYLVSKCQHKILRCLLASIEVRWPYDSLIFIVKSWYVERQSHDCLIFNGNPDTSKGHLYIATGPYLQACLLFARGIQSFYTTLCLPVFTVMTLSHNFYPILLFPGVCFLRLQSNGSMMKICNWRVKHRIYFKFIPN